MDGGGGHPCHKKFSSMILGILINIQTVKDAYIDFSITKNLLIIIYCQALLINVHANKPYS